MLLKNVSDTCYLKILEGMENENSCNYCSAAGGKTTIVNELKNQTQHIDEECIDKIKSSQGSLNSSWEL